jgi:EmrB/QacA subfamily drug resistance transporter
MAVRRPPRRWLILAAVLTGTLAGTFGSSLVNVSLPAIIDDFGVPLGSAVWVQTIFTLLVAVLMPVFGRLGDMVGYKRIYLAGMGLLAASSVLAAFAPSFPLLVGARALQGIGNATTLPSVMAIITAFFHDRERGRAMGAWAAVNGAAHGLGPVIGGYLTQNLGWPAIFLFLGALTGLGLLAIGLLLPGDARRVEQSFDLLGAAALTLAMVALMLNLTQGARLGWTAPLSLLLTGAFLALMAAFVLVEKRVKPPFVELSLFANRGYTAAATIIATQFFCLFGMQLLLPLFLVRVQGRSAGSAGLLIAGLSLTSAAVAPLAGRLADSLGSRRLCIAGMALVAATGALLLRWGPATPPWQIVATLVVLGAGMGLIQSPVATAVTLAVGRDQLGVALGIFNMTRFIGASLGTIVFGLILGKAISAQDLALYRLDFFVLIGVALAAIPLTARLPVARGPVTDLRPSGAGG